MKSLLVLILSVLAIESQARVVNVPLTFNDKVTLRASDVRANTLQVWSAQVVKKTTSYQVLPPRDPDSGDETRVLTTAPVVRLTAQYTERRPSVGDGDSPYQTITFDLNPLNFSSEQLALLNQKGRKHIRAQVALFALTTETKNVVRRVVDYSRSIICDADSAYNCVDQIVYKDVADQDLVVSVHTK